MRSRRSRWRYGPRSSCGPCREPLSCISTSIGTSEAAR
jgi:hypothetical protein